MSLVLRVFVDEKFLHNKNNKDVYVDYGAIEDIPEDACSLRQSAGSMDGCLTTLN